MYVIVEPNGKAYSGKKEGISATSRVNNKRKRLLYSVHKAGNLSPKRIFPLRFFFFAKTCGTSKLGS